MSIAYGSVKNVIRNNGGSKSISTYPIQTTTVTPTTYVRPADWLALSVPGPTAQAVNMLVAVTNDDTNFFAINTTTSGTTVSSTGLICNGQAGIAGNKFIALNLAITYTTGMLLYAGTGTVANGTIITGVENATFAGSISTTQLTVTSVTSGTITPGMVLAGASVTASTYITFQISGTPGGVGVYSLNQTSGGTSFTGRVYTVSVTGTTALTTIQGGGGVQIDWGDGSAIQYTFNGLQTNKLLSWSSYSAGTLTTRGYRQAVITVTPITGFNLTGFTVAKYQAISGQGTINAYATKILDIAAGGPFITNLTIGQTVAPCTWLEQANIISIGTNPSITFNACGNLRNVVNIAVPASGAWSASSMFQSCANLQTIPIFDTSRCNNMLSMFSGCFNLLSVPEFNTINVTSMVTMFNACNKLLTIPQFNTVNVTAMNSMFSNCLSLQYVPLMDTGNVINMSSMFNNCNSLKVIPTLNTSKVTNMNLFASNCWSLINVQSFNLPLCTNPASMFIRCYSLEKVGSINIPIATTTDSMFQFCYNLISIDSITTGNALLSASAMYGQCWSLASVPLINTSRCTVVAEMHYQNYNLQVLPQYDYANATNALRFVQSCQSLRTIPDLNLSKVTSLAGTFQGCTNLNTIGNITTTSLLLDTSTAFYLCSGLLAGPDITYFNTNGVTNINAMYQGCFSLITTPSHNTSNVTNFVSYLDSCTNLQYLPAIDTSKATTINGMFSGCSSLNSTPTLNLTNVTSATTAFSTAASLSTINASNLKVTTSIASDNLSANAIQNVFANVILANTTAQTITITSNPGADTANVKTSNMTVGNSTILMANTVGIIAGTTFLYGTGLNTGIQIVFTGGTNIFFYSSGANHGLQNGDSVMFTAFSSNPGMVLNTQYFVINRTASNFQLSTTPGGVVQTLSVSSSGTASIGGATIANRVLTVNANANVIINGVAGVTNATASLSARNLNQNYATTKNWIVSG
jgi:surface protein